MPAEIPGHLIAGNFKNRCEIRVLAAAMEPPTNKDIDRSGEAPDLWTVDLALGLRPYRRLAPFSTDEVRKLALGWTEKGSLVAQYSDERHNIHRWYFSPGEGYALTDYTVSLPDGTLFEDVEPSEFKIYGNVALPAHILRRSIYYDHRGNAKPMKTIELTQITFDVHDPGNSEEGMYIKWPKGSLIGDRRTAAQLVVRERDQTMDDATIETYLRKAATQPAISPSPSKD
jgi:hypothetical protein